MTAVGDVLLYLVLVLFFFFFFFFPARCWDFIKVTSLVIYVDVCLSSFCFRTEENLYMGDPGDRFYIFACFLDTKD